MQKFTRPLTREIEVGGERLAVTLGPEGLSLRPVGSRRPPHSLSWAQVACACAGALPSGPEPTSQEVAAALQALRGGASASAGPAGGAGAGEKADLRDLLKRLERWLSKNRKHYLEGLAPGATPEELATLESRLGSALPDELESLLRWHNGQDPDTVGAFVESFALLGTEDIAQEMHDLAEDEKAGWPDSWVPFLADGQGDYLCLDTSQDGPPVREVWRGRKDREVVAPSLTEWLLSFVADAEAGRYHEDPERGDLIRSSEE